MCCDASKCWYRDCCSGSLRTGRRKEFVGSMTSIWSCKYAGRDHCGVLTTHAPLSSCSNIEYSVFSSLGQVNKSVTEHVIIAYLFASTTVRSIDSQSLAGLKERCDAGIPCSANHDVT